MSISKFLAESWAYDFEYHPRQVALYLLFAAAGIAIWLYWPLGNRFTTRPLSCALGSAGLLINLVYGELLLRPGQSPQRNNELSAPSGDLERPSLPEQVALGLRDFGTGLVVLSPFLRLGRYFNPQSSSPARALFFVIGAFLIFLSWLIRRGTSTNEQSQS